MSLVGSPQARAAPSRATVIIESNAPEQADSRTFARAVDDAVQADLYEAGIQTRRAPEDPWFVVTLGFVENGATYVIARARASDPLKVVTQEMCSPCNADEVAERIVSRVGNKKPAKPRRASRASKHEHGRVPTPSSPSTDAEQARAFRPLGQAGIGLLVAGSTIALLGGLFVGRGEVTLSGDPDNYSNVRTQDFRVPGYALLATGGAAVVVGLALLGTDWRHLRKRRGRR